MLNINFFRFSMLALALTVSATSFAAPGKLDILKSAPYQLITLTAGTQISVSLNEAIDGESVAVGNAIDFTVRSNVTVNGKVVIAAGSTATGWVKNVKKSCGGKCAEITITVESAQAVDGQTVNLRSIPHIVKAPCCEGTTTTNIGTNLTAHVLNDLKINA